MKMRLPLWDGLVNQEQLQSCNVYWPLDRWYFSAEGDRCSEPFFLIHAVVYLEREKVRSSYDELVV